jgi:hypothetical protein
MSGMEEAKLRTDLGKTIDQVQRLERELYIVRMERDDNSSVVSLLRRENKEVRKSLQEVMQEREAAY